MLGSTFLASAPYLRTHNLEIPKPLNPDDFDFSEGDIPHTGMGNILDMTTQGCEYSQYYGHTGVGNIPNTATQGWEIFRYSRTGMAKITDMATQAWPG